MEEKNTTKNTGILEYLKGDFFRVESYDVVSSTNDICKEKALNNEREGLVAIADYQTAGRGRQGKSFYSPDGCGIYMSILLRPKKSVEDAMYLTPFAAVAVSEAIEKVIDVDTKIKWVNDIYINDRKVCGILMEAAINPEMKKLDYVIVGIGINVYAPDVPYPDEIKDIATPLFFGKKVDDAIKNKLVAEVLNCFYRIYVENNIDECLEKYREKSFLNGKLVTYFKNRVKCVAKVLDVDEQFFLVVENTEDKTIEKLSSGEVTVLL